MQAEDKMKIHDPHSVGTTGGDYFYNYFAHGVVSSCYIVMYGCASHHERVPMGNVTECFMSFA